jgi:hypothetical protein
MIQSLYNPILGEGGENSRDLRFVHARAFGKRGHREHPFTLVRVSEGEEEPEGLV